MATEELWENQESNCIVQTVDLTPAVESATHEVFASDQEIEELERRFGQLKLMLPALIEKEWPEISNLSEESIEALRQLEIESADSQSELPTIIPTEDSFNSPQAIDQPGSPTQDDEESYYQSLSRILKCLLVLEKKKKAPSMTVILDLTILSDYNLLREQA
jgi:hypothetical protein